MDERRVVAIGGGGFSMEPENLMLDAFVLSLARSPSPRVCFVPTASGDSPDYVARFYRAFSSLECRPTDLPLFNRKVDDLEAFVLKQDVIYVGGGNTANLLAIWRAHGLDDVLTRAWSAGIVLAGISAGMNCWFEESVTDSLGPALTPLTDGLGLLPGSACPHYDGEEKRRPAYHHFIESGELSPGWAADDGAAVVFAGTAAAEIVSSRPDAAAYRVERATVGVSEQRLTPRHLGQAT